MGKPPPGLLDGNLNWLGSYDECLAIDVHVNSSSFNGRYCSASATIPQVDEHGTISLKLRFRLQSVIKLLIIFYRKRYIHIILLNKYQCHTRLIAVH